MAFVEPIIVVLGPFGGGTSAVAKVLHHLGVFMGTEFDWTYREPHDTWEESRLSLLCRRAFSEPGGQLQMDTGALQVQLRAWAADHRQAAHMAERPPGVKHPSLCLAIDFIRDAWGAVVPVVVDRPIDKVVASLNRLGWWNDEQERASSAAHLVAARDAALDGTEVVRVDFEALRSTPASVIRRLADDLQLNVTDAQVDEAVQSIVQAADVLDADPYGLDVLLAEVERNPGDRRVVSILAQTYFDSGDFINARKRYTRIIEMGGSSPEEVYIAMFRVAVSMERLDEPWPYVQDAYLRAWEFRPTRAEALHAIAFHHRVSKQYHLGHMFAERAAEIPFPETDMMLVDAAVLAWRAVDEQAVCASWIGKHHEAFTLFRRLLARPDLPEQDRHRIANNRDLAVPAMIKAAAAYPDARAHALIAGARDAEVTVSLIAGPGTENTQQALNSFLNCCTDVREVGRFLVIDTGLSHRERTMLHERYEFLEFADSDAQLGGIRAQVHSRYWLHLSHGWQFFAPDDFITRLSAVLEAEGQVFQVGINFEDAAELTGRCAPEQVVRRAPNSGRYVLTDLIATGPAMFDTTRLDQTGGTNAIDTDPVVELTRRAAVAGLKTASLDEVFCRNAI